MSADNVVHDLLAHYPSGCRPRRIERLGQAGGFSGATFWRLDTALGPLCLRKWPREHPDARHLAFIHDVLRHVSRRGFQLAPLPLTATGTSGETFIEREGALWELTPWLPGVADYHESPSRAKLVAAMQVLARFHLAAGDFAAAPTAAQPSPGIQARWDAVERWQSGDLASLVASIDAGASPVLRPLADRIIERFEFAATKLLDSLNRAARIAVPQQPCIRDVWDRHVLFEGEVVTGLIDFGAMKTDTVATDIARLLGSLAGDDPVDRQAGLEAYQHLRPLSASEQQLIGTFDFSIVLLSGLNWLRWIYLEGREFSDQQAIISRLETILARLACVRQ